MWFRNTFISGYFSLFASLSTLMCCAVPSFLVMLGLGAMFASFVSAFPAIKWFGENATPLFTIAGILLIINGFVIYKNRNKPCNITQAKTCAHVRKIGNYVFLVSIVIYILAVIAKFWYLLQ